MDFWSRLDALLAAHEVVIDRPSGTRHPRFPSLVYPLDYGYLRGTTGGDGNAIDLWRGSQTPAGLVGIVCTADSLKGDAEVKLLLGCTAQELEAIHHFYQDSRDLSGLLIPRPSAVCVSPENE